jgi:hypothetical protein
MGLFEPTCVQYSEGRIREEKNKIDLYVWFEGQINSREYRVLGNPNTQERVCDLLKVDMTQVKMLSPAA